MIPPFQHSIVPIFLLKGSSKMIDRTHGYYRKEKETMSKERERAYLKEKLSEILRYGYHHSKAIRSRFDKVGFMPEDIRDLKDLGEITHH